MLQILGDELLEIENIVANSPFYPRNYLDEVYDNSFETFDRNLLPFLVLLGSYDKDEVSDDAYIMGAVFQFVIAALRVHEKVTNEDNISIQLPVLLGDLLFADAYKYMAYNDLNKYVGVISQVVESVDVAWFTRKRISENSKSTPYDYINVLDNEYGELLAKAVDIGGEIGEMDEVNLNSLKGYARNLGIIWGAQRLGIKVPTKQIYSKACDYLNRLDDVLPKYELQNILDFISDK